MKKKFLILAVLALFFASSSAVLALESEGMGPDAGTKQNTSTQNQGVGSEIKNRIQEWKNASKEKKDQILQDILARAKKAATNAIDRAITRFNKVKDRVQKMPNISAENKAAVVAKIDSEIAKLQTAKAKVTAATTTAEVRAVMTEVKTQIKESVNGVKLVVAAIHATHLENIVNKLNTILEKLTARVNELKNQGKDVSELETITNRVKSSLESAKANIAANQFKTAKENILEARKQLVELSQKIKAMKDSSTNSESDSSTGSDQGGAE